MRMQLPRFFFYLYSFLFLTLGLGGSVAEAKVVLPAIFGDNMVLQQKDKVQFFGKARPHGKVTVRPSWCKKKYKAKVDAQGNWEVTIPTPAAGRGFTVSFNDGEELVLKNVLIGEVWLASGQSNMQMPLTSWLGNVLNHEKEIAQANYPDIRFLQVEHVSSPVPLQNMTAPESWEVCSPETVSDFSAVAYFFARNLHLRLDVPIGIIHSSWGGTDIEAWISKSSLKTIPAFAKEFEEKEKRPFTEEELQKKYEQEMALAQKSILAKDAGYRNVKPVWAANDLADQDWPKMNLPGYWDAEELPKFDGVVWFRKKVVVPAGWANHGLKLSLGEIDDNETTWFNGEKIGHTEGYSAKREYNVPTRFVKPGENVITVRVEDNGGNGGMHGLPSAMFLANSSGEKMALEGEWRYRAAVDFSSLPPLPRQPEIRNQISGLYNAMIHPLLPVSIKGVIWYQGENNAGRAKQYKNLFPLLIQDWRTHWKEKDLPFYFVQLANFKEQRDLPGESDWAELREAQLLTLSVPNTGMAVTIDVGDATNIHPTNKQAVGERLARIARAKTYGENLVFSGPLFKAMTLSGNRAILAFQNTGSGLTIKGDSLIGFALAGEDHKFYWAKAVIEGDSVVVSSPMVPNPVAVRYGWADNPTVNLYNKEGLPASPFRTDSWSVSTVENK